MCPMPDLLRLHADASGDRAAVIVDEAGGGRPAAVTFEGLNSSVNRLPANAATITSGRVVRSIVNSPNLDQKQAAMPDATISKNTAVP